MKVLLINSVCGYGSTGKICTDLYDMLVEDGHECCIAYGRYSAPDGYNTIKIGNRLDNYYHVLLTRLFDRHGFGSKRTTKKFIREIEAYDPDIIHLHNIHGYYLNIEILFNYLRRSNKKVIWTLHDCWAFTGHCSYFTYARCSKWKNGCSNCSQFKEYPSSLLTDRSRKNYQAKRKIFQGISNLTIVSPSKWLGDLVKESFLQEYTVKTINNGIDINIFKDKASSFKEIYHISQDKMILGIASIFDKRKGIETFFQLRKDISDDIAIVLIGVSEEQKSDLPKGIIGITRTNNRDELVDAYNAADVFVNPTLEDNYPTTNLEAIACHTPVITTDVGGCIETITSKSGIVVSNYEELLKVVNAVMSGNIRFSFDRIEDKVDKYKKFKEYIDLYKGV